MNYIVVDFEWNQSAYGKCSVPRIPFEIIEIGAVKLDEQGRKTGEFHRLIRPAIYKKLHYVTKNLTGLTESELRKGIKFPYALVDFLMWCGKDYRFCTWGNLDLLELQRNIKYYHLEDMLPGPITYYNVQKLFRIFYGDGKNAASLEYAVEFLGIEKQAGFHRAVNDADYTARIFNRMDKKEAARWYTVDYYQNPKSRKEELHLVYDTYAKDVSREFATREEAMKDREVRTTRCFVCGRPAAKKIRWFSGKNRAYYCLAQCREHGYIRGKIRLKKTDEDKIFAVKTLRLITEEEAGNIRNMKEEMREKRLEKKHREEQHEG